MEENTQSEISKKRKIDETKHVNYYAHGGNHLFRNAEKYSNKFSSANTAHSRKFVRHDYNRGSQYNPSTGPRSLPPQACDVAPNFGGNAPPTQGTNSSFGNFCNRGNHANHSNYGKNYINGRGVHNEVNPHPFINYNPPKFTTASDAQNKEELELKAPPRIFLQKNLPSEKSVIRMEKENMIQQKKDKAGLSSREYTKYNVRTENDTSYEHARKLNILWSVYVCELLDVTNSKELSLDTINEMEFNGAQIEIHKSRCATYIGIKGIVILETQYAFKIVTPDNKILVILKNKTVFIIYIQDKQYYLHGVQIMRDPALKSAKRYKKLQNRVI
ncbi:ribonuclease P protein subunit p29, putative [Plasmodium ovale]|uniref:Ribonuclease P protein subunit p29, putative n=2 Tax=Plasmodium ovale TaxID=36330 RepID=A0A1D3TJ54_PLAOA|nr:ribonuclease P protein subunit p29, putative (POP4) [Plasmodium ovale curtisi]SBS94080.1 ribonuclease P protein subunit p29, putative (POP4) [Plasmodium ovale curtisi]SCP04992.1 ribonuclease P protein subunit p29, putative [Plasmodium ovale]